MEMVTMIDMTIVTSMTTDKTERKQQFHLLSFDYHLHKVEKNGPVKDYRITQSGIP